MASGVAAAAGSLLGGWLGGRGGCHCSCAFENDQGLIGLLRDQLARCGPEQLRLAPVDCPGVAVPWAAGFLSGLLVGLLVAALAAALALPARRTARRGDDPSSERRPSAPARGALKDVEPGFPAVGGTPSSLRR